jgi:glyoxylase-like metal-dependent hydrolase (beta-lactamase superfamily II)
MKSKMFILDNGTTDADLSVFLRNHPYGEKVTVPTIVSVVIHPDAAILFDTGIGDPNSETAKRFNYQAGKNQMLAEQLKRIGIDPTDISFVVNSHLHWDHCGNNYLFKDKPIYVRPEEYTYAMGESMNNNQFAYSHDALGIDRIDKVNYEMLPNGGEDIKLLDGIDLLFTPGHTAGTQSMLVDTNSGPVLLASDSINILSENLYNEVLPGICFSDDLQVKTISKIRNLGNIIIIPGHDPYCKLATQY